MVPVMIIFISLLSKDQIRIPWPHFGYVSTIQNNYLLSKQEKSTSVLAYQYPCSRSFVLIFLFHHFQSLFLHRTGIGTSFPQLLYFHIPLETTKVKDSTGKHYSPYFVLATCPQYVRNNSNQIQGNVYYFLTLF